jgi:hypothetical protein
MFQGSTGNRVGSPTTRLELGSMRQTAAGGCRVSAHTHPSPVATEKPDTGKRIRATIAPSLPGGIDAVLAELGSLAEVLAEFAGSRVVVQPDTTTATPTAMAAVSLIEIGALT